MMAVAAVSCALCGYTTAEPEDRDLGNVRGNTKRFKDRQFPLWKCPKCQSIHSLEPVDMVDIYRDYPPNRRRLDVFARGTLGNLLKRLRRAGLTKGASILDYGCGNGVFIDFLRQRGYLDCTGYDPYFPQLAEPPEREYDCVVVNDVVEHVEDPRSLLQQCVSLVKPGGLLYVGTADSEPVDMGDLEPHLMRLHQPFHRVIVTEQGLHRLARETGLTPIRSWRRSYMDTLMPFANYRFLDEFNRALGHDMDRAMDPAAGAVLGKQPKLLLFALLGYFMPCAWEPAVLLRKAGDVA